MFRRGSRGWFFLALGGGLVAGCAANDGDDGTSTSVAVFGLLP